MDAPQSLGKDIELFCVGTEHPTYAPVTAMNEIESQFNATFARWNICLPPEDISQRKRGKIVKSGWAIWYLFGSDDNGEYLDYYASHRMTNDRHIRIYTTGYCEMLPAIQDCLTLTGDQDEKARLKSEFFAEKQRVAKMLEDKGFGLCGDEPVSVQVNRYLSLRNIKETEEDA